MNKHIKKERNLMMHIIRPLNEIKLYFLTAAVLFTAMTLECISQEKRTNHVKQDSIIAAAREIMSLQTYCALVTIDSCGKPQIRTMNPFPPEDDMTVWIATNSRSKKIKEIRNNPNVCLYYSNHAKAIGYTVIKGKAILVDDIQEKLKRKREYWNQAFPDFTYLMLIKVVPEEIEVINYKYGMVNDPATFKAPFIELK